MKSIKLKKQWYQKWIYWILPFFIFPLNIELTLIYGISQMVIAVIYAAKLENKGWRWYYYLLIPISIFVLTAILSGIYVFIKTIIKI